MPLLTVTRIEVIDGSGRAYSKHGLKGVYLSFQDEGRTLKVFADDRQTSDEVVERWLNERNLR